MIRPASDAVGSMILDHSRQYGDFPAVIIIDRITSQRLKQENGKPWDNWETVSRRLDPKNVPSHFMGVAVEVIE